MGTQLTYRAVGPRGIFSVIAKVIPESSFAIKAKLYDLSGNVLKRSDISSISYSVRKNETEISSGNLVVNDVVFDELKFDTDWVYDFDGYNFLAVFMASLEEGIYNYIISVTTVNSQVLKFNTNVVVSYE